MKRKYEKGSNSSLSEDIVQKFESLKKEKEENDALKHSWVNELQSIARQEYPTSKLVLTGSSANMFGFKRSDCDLTLLTGTRLVYSVTALEKVEKLLPKSKFSTLVIKTVVRGAKVPVLKLKDKENSLEADINCQCERNIQHTYLLRCYALLDPRVQPLGLVIKLWAKNAGIINQRDHKLSGFTLLLLYIHYLQVGCSPPVVPLLQDSYSSLFSIPTSQIIDLLMIKELPEELKKFESTNKEALGDLFVGFFRFYAKFNWSNVISIRRRNAYVSNNRPYMKIEDPFELRGNCARGIYEYSSFHQIKKAFSDASRKLEDSMDLSGVL